MIITIDGPATSGKSTTARALSARLQYFYINSGFLFRALAYYLFEHEHLTIKNIAQREADSVIALWDRHLVYRYDAQLGPRVFLNEGDITSLLKDRTIDMYASQIAQLACIREAVVYYQRRLANVHNVIVEGRDAGTVVFPHADIKFYITAALSLRAERWRKAQEAQGHIYTNEESVESILIRDRQDSTRFIAPLEVASGARVIDTTGLTIEQTVDVLNDYIKKATQ